MSKFRGSWPGLEATRTPLRGHTLGLVTMGFSSFGLGLTMSGGVMVSEFSIAGFSIQWERNFRVDSGAGERLAQCVAE